MLVSFFGLSRCNATVNSLFITLNNFRSPTSPSAPLTHCHAVHLLCSLYGDEQEVAFWTVALYYMLREKNRLQDPRYRVT